jgi:hypothetical protein
MKNEEAKRGRGRPKGATSFSRIRLGDLNDHLGKEATVMVSKKWLEQMGINIPVEGKKTLTPIDDEPKIQFNITD